MCFTGKSRSFTCMDDAKCIGDLEKLQIPEAKRQKYGLYHCGGSCLSFMEAVADKELNLTDSYDYQSPILWALTRRQINGDLTTLMFRNCLSNRVSKLSFCANVLFQQS